MATKNTKKQTPRAQWNWLYLVLTCLLVIAFTVALTGPPTKLQKAFIKYKVFPSVRMILVSNPQTGEVLGGGTGFVIHTSALGTVILTNSHICGINENYVNIDMESRTTLRQARIDVINDVCMLVGKPYLAPALKLATQPAAPGDQVFVSGHPHLQETTLAVGEALITDSDLMPIGTKEILEPKFKITCEPVDGFAAFLGALSGMDCYVIRRSTRLTAHIFPGNSGSPVTNAWGEVIGIIWGYNPSEGTSLMVPLEAVKELLK